MATKWWSKRKYKADEMFTAKWHREDREYYINSEYVWYPERNAYQVTTRWKEKIPLDVYLDENDTKSDS